MTRIYMYMMIAEGTRIHRGNFNTIAIYPIMKIETKIINAP